MIRINGKNLVEICEDYLKEIENLTNKLSEIFSVSNFKDIRKNVFPSFIAEKKGYKLEYHGCGVRILYEQDVLFDFDFGVENQVCGLNPFRIYQYIGKNVITEKELRREFDRLLITGCFKKINEQYYLITPHNIDIFKKYKNNNKS